MSAILMKDHIRIIGKVRQQERKLVRWLATFIFILICILWGVLLQKNKILKDYELVSVELASMKARHEIFSLMRPHALTVGQAMDIVDVSFAQNEIPIPIIVALLQQESMFGVTSISSKGASGGMQMMPLTYSIHMHNPKFKDGKHIFDPVLNMKSSLNYLTKLKTEHKDWTKVLRGYVGGQGNINNKKYDWYARSVLKKANL